MLLRPSEGLLRVPESTDSKARGQGEPRPPEKDYHADAGHDQRRDTKVGTGGGKAGGGPGGGVGCAYRPEATGPAAAPRSRSRSRDASDPVRRGIRAAGAPRGSPGTPGLERDPHRLQGSGVGPGPGEQEVSQSRLPGVLRGRGGRHRASQGLEGRVAGAPQQQKTALQRPLELHSAARLRRRRDRKQQRLRVLERLHIARNRHCRFHPVGLPPSPAQLPPHEDAAGRRRAMREQLEQMHRERTERLRALRARNTQNFLELLCSPDAEDPLPAK
ncbi:uncharacterized protein LOC100595942 [Nomascus leucogenys]|uniref:uncharacterized protein LOC100595942 n=1 Tax=Nomascus leucogenys TaxID=61853 RepID=UPI00122DA199|nr:uncharacterized protein LOC100595942 [Nomascus leucogenys]